MVNDIRPTPDATVVIPTRNREAMLSRAVRSCFESGGDRSVEVVVSVDGAASTYAAGLEAASEGVVVVRSESPGGRGRARNAGLVAARGRFMKFLDDDDWLEPGALAAELGRAEESGADIVASGHRVAGDGREEEVFWPPQLADGIDSLLRGEAVPTAAALYRREILAGVRWAERPCKLDDWHFFLCAALQARTIVTLRQVAYTWFSHPGQVVQQTAQLEHVRDFYWILDELERTLEARGEMNEARRRRLAQYRYKELRALCRLDRMQFEVEVRRIRTLDPGFSPLDEERKWWMRWLSRAVGFRRANLLLVGLKSRLGRE